MADWEDELAALTTQRGTALVGYAYLLCGNRRDAEDVVQDALVKVFSRLRGRGPAAARQSTSVATGSGTRLFALEDAAGHDGPTVTHLEAYVRRTILTLYLDGYRRRRHWLGLRHVVARSDSVPGPESPASARADTARALAGLTPRQRACVVLRYYEDQTVPRIAEDLGCAEGTVKRHLSDAMAVMQRTLWATPPVAAAPVPAPRTTTVVAPDLSSTRPVEASPSTANGRNPK
ncbi:RNA polymerase subunit sigma-24 [Oerskovia sp. Sa1BUA8]|uniref:RNA polymerase subunit sigma-24 n=1 Tax=Oerskovia douganii TaxID=2762210 RepID=A0A9D5U6G1_9CELL|nr:sigma factor-like helix-turn-helix DNA-binding protein [Oerskovia douganii]MBE7698720.1 RNA polymerase subunit sigma-24 [Oerskovia douganii]